MIAIIIIFIIMISLLTLAMKINNDNSLWFTLIAVICLGIIAILLGIIAYQSQKYFTILLYSSIVFSIGFILNLISIVNAIFNMQHQKKIKQNLIDKYKII